MKSLFKVIRNLVLIVVVVGSLTALVDYLNMSNGKLPVFSLVKYDDYNKVQSFQGILYTASRKVKVSTSEDLIDSSNIEFKLFFAVDLKVNLKEPNRDDPYTIGVKKIDNCNSSTLYYADLKNKVYTYCLDNVYVNGKELDTYLKDGKVDLLEDTLSYTGLASDRSTMIFKNSDVTMFKCNKKNINDIYIGGSDLTFKDDFCTYKDDDLKFIFEIKEEVPKDSNLPDQVETFYEDEKYKYQFSQPKSEYVFIVSPKVRGKEETKIKLKDVLNSKLLTIKMLEEKGLVFEKVEK